MIKTLERFEGRDQESCKVRLLGLVEKTGLCNKTKPYELKDGHMIFDCKERKIDTVLTCDDGSGKDVCEKLSSLKRILEPGEGIDQMEILARFDRLSKSLDAIWKPNYLTGKDVGTMAQGTANTLCNTTIRSNGAFLSEYARRLNATVERLAFMQTEAKIENVVKCSKVVSR